MTYRRACVTLLGWAISASLGCAGASFDALLPSDDGEVDGGNSATPSSGSQDAEIRCSLPTPPGYCIIERSCWPAGALNPQNSCEKCDPARSYSGWTMIPVCASTIAGAGAEGLVNGPVGQASFKVPDTAAVAAGGAVYVTDKGNHCIRTIIGGEVSMFAGDGQAGVVNGPLATARFQYPAGLAIDSAGRLYVADAGAHVIRMIANGQVSTLAGDGTAGFVEGAAATARFNAPTDVAVDGAGTVYVADHANHRIRAISNGQVSTLAGSGSAGYADGPAATATFNYPDGLAVDGAGTVYVVDRDNHRIRKIAGGQVSTVAGAGGPGFADGPAAQAQFAYPRDVAVGSEGRLYVADRFNHRIRLIAGGQVSTVAGDGTAGFADGAAMRAKFNEPFSVALDPGGGLVVSDTNNRRIRFVSP